MKDRRSSRSFDGMSVPGRYLLSTMRMRLVVVTAGLLAVVQSPLRAQGPSPVEQAGQPPASPASKPTAQPGSIDTATIDKIMDQAVRNIARRYNLNAEQRKKTDASVIPSAVVIEVVGTVDRASPGVSPLALQGWTAIGLDDRLPPGTQIRTGLRSHVNLRFGETTTVSVRSATHASIDQFYRSATTENVRIGLAYGTVRGGSTEGRLRSDVVVDSTVATLAKRGTEGWQLWVEPMTGRFRVSLARHGLVEAIQKLGLAGDRRISRTLRPGEYVTADTIANLWIRQAVFDRIVTFYEANFLTEADAEFTTANTRGFGTLAPGGGTSLVDLSERVSAEFILAQTAGTLPVGQMLPTTALLQHASRSPKTYYRFSRRTARSAIGPAAPTAAAWSPPWRS